MYQIYILFIIILFLGMFIYIIQSYESFIVNPNPPASSAIQNEIRAMSLPQKLISNIRSCTAIQYPLSQYAIKASYNSANSGSFVSKDAIQYVLQRGCRFLDFEIYVDEKGGANPGTPDIAVVAYSTIRGNHISQNIKLDSQNLLSLDDALSTCISSAFTSRFSPNYNDPLFIHMRLNTGQSSLEPVVRSIQYALMPKLYMENNVAVPVNSNTILKDIMGKIICVVDAGSLNIDVLKPYINIYSNSNQWQRYFYRHIDNMPTHPPQMQSNTDIFNLTTLRKLSMILPASIVDTKIPYPFDVFGNYGIQTLFIPFYKINDKNIIKYEQLFNTVKGGVVPYSLVLSYSNDMML